MDDSRRRKLLYRATYRGFKEADIVIGSFAAARLPDMIESELDEFERLLEVPDRELYAWVINKAVPPSDYTGPVLDMMRSFKVSDVITDKA